MRCKNCQEKSYTGKENTPLGKGYSASVEKIGKKMRGRDGNMYIVKKYKNGKRWIKLSKGRKSSPRGALSPNEIRKFLDEAEEICPGMKEKLLNAEAGDAELDKYLIGKLMEKNNDWIREKFLNKLRHVTDEEGERLCDYGLVFRQMIGYPDDWTAANSDDLNRFIDEWEDI